MIYFLLAPYILAINAENGEIIWKIDLGPFPNGWAYMSAICGDNLFLAGDHMYMAVDKKTGGVLYEKEAHGCTWVVEHNGYVYANILERIKVIDCASGDVLSTIVCPEEEESGDGFHTAPKASFYNDKMYVLSGTSAYCYPTYPWQE